MLDKKYPERIKATDLATGENADRIICSKRTDENGSIVLFANTAEKREVTAKITLDDDKQPYMIDHMDGELYSLPCGELVHKFYPAGSLAVYIPNEAIDAPPVKPEPVSTDSVVIDSFETTLTEQNVMPINDASCWLDGKLVLENKPLSMFWHNYFYKAADGTPFKIEYTFEIVNSVPSGVFAAIENAENLDSITINGKPAAPAKVRGELGSFDTTKSWTDISFTRVDIANNLVLGKNTIVIHGKKVNNVTKPGEHRLVHNTAEYYPTEAEVIYIVGDFSVTTADNIVFKIDGGLHAPDFKDLTVSGYPFYNGRARLKTTFKGKAKHIKLNMANCAGAKLFINNKQAGIKYWAPFIFEVEDLMTDGENEIVIELSTTLFNLMGPNRNCDIPEQKFVGPYSFIDHRQFKEAYTLLPFGVGNIEIL